MVDKRRQFNWNHEYIGTKRFAFGVAGYIPEIASSHRGIYIYTRLQRPVGNLVAALCPGKWLEIARCFAFVNETSNPPKGRETSAPTSLSPSSSTSCIYLHRREASVLRAYVEICVCYTEFRSIAHLLNSRLALFLFYTYASVSFILWRFSIQSKLAG